MCTQNWSLVIRIIRFSLNSIYMHIPFFSQPASQIHSWIIETQNNPTSLDKLFFPLFISLHSTPLAHSRKLWSSKLKPNTLVIPSGILKIKSTWHWKKMQDIKGGIKSRSVKLKCIYFNNLICDFVTHGVQKKSSPVCIIIFHIKVNECHRAIPKETSPLAELVLPIKLPNEACTLCLQLAHIPRNLSYPGTCQSAF